MSRLTQMMHSQRGETIVEVMISAVILGFTITTVYVIAKNSLNTGQAAKERSQALTIAESQAERLKFMAKQSGATGPNGIFGQVITKPFCIEVGPTGTMLLTYVVTSTKCDHGLFPASNLNINIMYDKDGADTTSPYDNDTFLINVSWDRAGGSKNREELNTVYRVHAPPGVGQ